jgi:hypothetical protein
MQVPAIIYGIDFSVNHSAPNQIFTLKKPTTMSRQNRNTVRDRKNEEPKRDVAGSNERYSRQNSEASRQEQNRNETNVISGLDRYRLNDLYERSSI